MADKTILEAEVKTNIKSVTKDVKGLDKATDQAGKGFKTLGSTIKGMGAALKAAGIGIVVALVAKLFEVFSKNQKVIDAFNTAMTALDIVFNDLFDVISNTAGNIVGWFKELFEDPQQKIADLGQSIKNGIIDRFNQMLEVMGYLGEAVNYLFEGEFTKAAKTAAKAQVEFYDVLTGTDKSVEKITKSVVKYTKQTYENAKATTESGKAANKAQVEFAKLNAIKLQEAEVLRQIRDDETKTFAERIQANKDLDKVLAEQQELQRAQLKIMEEAAQRQYNINQTDENYIALQETKVAQLELEETITGQLSEQKTNQVALEKELLETQNELRAEGLSGIERELEELEASYKLKLDMARKSGMDTTAITKQFEQQKSAIVASGVEQQLGAYSNLAGALQQLAGENKALAIAQAIMDTYAAANKALANVAGNPWAMVEVAAIIATGLANVQKIMDTEVPGQGGSGGGSVPSAGASQTPSPQMMGGTFQLEGGQAPEPVQAYVVSDDITNNQDKLAAIRRRATI
tara:strand:+ start:598 stop:2154 length:1557 start_codon:yes stop_codon:yes gene_type:complete